MLFIKYEKRNTCHVALVIDIKKIFFCIWSLQAQVRAWLRKRKGALRFVSCEGSVTVETVLVLPVFLCVTAGLLMLGNLLLTEAKIQYALTKTVDIYAAQKAWPDLSAGDSGGQSSKTGQPVPAETAKTGVSDTAKSMAQSMLAAAGVQTIFSSVYESSAVDSDCIYGGRAGIVLAASEDENETVKISAVYRMKIEIPFVGKYSFPKKLVARQRIFSGYVESGGVGDDTSAGGTVYVTEHGSVYHTSLSCSHICLRISGGNVERILTEKKYQACDKCIDKGEMPSALYVTKYGDKYHSSLGCSGLKRTVKTISREEAEGMKMCSRCAAKQ